MERVCGEEWQSGREEDRKEDLQFKVEVAGECISEFSQGFLASLRTMTLEEATHKMKLLRQSVSRDGNLATAKAAFEASSLVWLFGLSALLMSHRCFV